jgi:nitrogen fixation protein FixH
MTNRFVASMFLIPLFVLIAGCASSANSSVGESRNYTVRLELDATTVGERIVRLDIRDRAGEGTLLQQVVVIPKLPATGVASPEVIAVPQVNGQYQASPVTLNQAGEWELVVRISGATGDEEATVVVQIQE